MKGASERSCVWMGQLRGEVLPCGLQMSELSVSVSLLLKSKVLLEGELLAISDFLANCQTVQTKKKREGGE